MIIVFKLNINLKSIRNNLIKIFFQINDCFRKRMRSFAFLRILVTIKLRYQKINKIRLSEIIIPILMLNINFTAPKNQSNAIKTLIVHKKRLSDKKKIIVQTKNTIVLTKNRHPAKREKAFNQIQKYRIKKMELAI